MLRDTYPYYFANHPRDPNADLEVSDKYTGQVVTRVAIADTSVISNAIGAAVNAAEPMRRMSPYHWQAILSHCADRFAARFDELAMSLCIEAGKPIRDVA